MRHDFKWKPVDKFRTKPISDFVEYTNDCYLNWMLSEREIRRAEQMYRVFISQPMNGLTEEEIKKQREEAIDFIDRVFVEEVSILDSYFEEEPPKGVNQGVWYLGKSIELLSQADYIYMCKGWEFARGCYLERKIAYEYGIGIIEHSDYKIEDPEKYLVHHVVKLEGERK